MVYSPDKAGKDWNSVPIEDLINLWNRTITAIGIITPVNPFVSSSNHFICRSIVKDIVQHKFVNSIVASSHGG